MIDYTFLIIGVLAITIAVLIVIVIVKTNSKIITPLPPTVILKDGFYVNDLHFNFKKYTFNNQSIFPTQPELPKTLIGLSYINLDSSNHLSYIVIDNVKYYIKNNIGVDSAILIPENDSQVYDFSSVGATEYSGDDVKYDGDGMYLLGIFTDKNTNKYVISLKITGFNLAGSIFTPQWTPSSNALTQDSENPYIYSGTFTTVDPSPSLPEYKFQANGAWNVANFTTLLGLCTGLGQLNTTIFNMTMPEFCINDNILYNSTFETKTFILNLENINGEVLSII